MLERRIPFNYIEDINIVILSKLFKRLVNYIACNYKDEDLFLNQMRSKKIITSETTLWLIFKN